jgi:hypothetical protein
MAWLNDNVYDYGLDWLDTNAINLYICSAEPTTYAQATSTYALGSKSGIACSAPAAKTGGGREVTISAISDGTVSANGTATHFAIVNPTGSVLVATGALSASQSVTSGNTFTLTQFTIGIPDPA